MKIKQKDQHNCPEEKDGTQTFRGRKEQEEGQGWILTDAPLDVEAVEAS